MRNLLTGQRISASKGIEHSQMAGQPGPDWKTVVEQIRAGQPPGEEDLYRTLATGARLFLQRRLGTQDVEDLVHDLFVIVVETIRRGDLREPERLMGFVRTVLHRQMSLGISRMVHKRENSINLGISSSSQQRSLFFGDDFHLLSFWMFGDTLLKRICQVEFAFNENIF